MTQYLLDQEWEEARQRLSLQEQVLDPATIGYLERIGVAEGWHCLEIGGGGGSIAAWLCLRVGSAGRVVATDLKPRFLKALEFPQLEVLEHDIVTDDLESGAFDLVHLREVLIHIPEREAVLRKLTQAVKPGGWLLAEETDVSTDSPEPTSPEPMRQLYRKVVEAIYSFLGDRGLDLTFGARLFGFLRSLDLEHLHAEGKLYMYRGGSAGTRSPHMMAFAQLREAVVSTGRVTDQEFQSFLDLSDNPEFAWREALTLSAWGRRPLPGP
ncbi:MAG: methyltransferase domain-containing protein [bacterium]|nr:methyltransferase domain-containing protein [bacterium]